LTAPYKRSARQKAAYRLLAEDMYTPSVFKNASILALTNTLLRARRSNLGLRIPSVLRSCAMHRASATFTASSFEDALHITNEDAPHISGPASWLVSFRRAQRGELYKSATQRSTVF
jgi:hypothetical protein